MMVSQTEYFPAKPVHQLDLNNSKSHLRRPQPTLKPTLLALAPQSTPSQQQPHRNMIQWISILVPRMNHTGPHLGTTGYTLVLQADSGRVNILTSYFCLYS